MKVLMVSDDLLIGGAARHVADLSNGLTAAGHHVTVAATDGPMHELLGPSVRFVPLRLKDNRDHRSRPAGLPMALWSLTHELIAQRYDIIHSHKRFSHLPSALASMLTGTPHITTYHTLFPGNHAVSLLGDRTICVSARIEQDLRTHRSRKRHPFITIHNGIHALPELPHEDRAAVRKAYAIPEGAVVIGSVGQFVPEKDRPTLLNAMRILQERARTVDAVLLLHGFGPMEEEIRTMSADLGLQKHVRFIGPSEPTYRTMAVCDLMVLNSVTEGFPLVILEAASIGVPHVATAVGGIPEFITDGETGLLVPPQDAAALADAILRFIEDPVLRRSCGRAARELYHERFSFAAMFERTVAVYRSLAGGVR